MFKIGGDGYYGGGEDGGDGIEMDSHQMGVGDVGSVETSVTCLV